MEAVRVVEGGADAQKEGVILKEKGGVLEAVLLRVTVAEIDQITHLFKAEEVVRLEKREQVSSARHNNFPCRE